MSWTEFQEVMKDNDLIILPIGVTEQHGRHNPIGTDNYIAEESAYRIAKKSGYPLAPTFRYGTSPSVVEFPGTISLDPFLLRKILISYCESFIKHGAKRFLFINGHGGNNAALDAACSYMYDVHGAICSHSEWWEQLPFLPKKWNCSEHGGLGETSLSMISRPGMVSMEHVAFGPTLPFIPGMQDGTFKGARIGLSTNLYKVNKIGTLGIPADDANEKLGEEMMEDYVNFLVELAHELKKVSI